MLVPSSLLVGLSGPQDYIPAAVVAVVLAAAVVALVLAAARRRDVPRTRAEEQEDRAATARYSSRL